MIKIRKASERGHAKYDWLDSYHTFSFADYHDPNYMGFRKLRVINEDRVKASEGFDTHPHRDMEIITVVFEGALEHKDSMGTGSVINPGDVQLMSAGTGVTHSEFNHSKKESVHLLQIWIMPEQRGLTPSYQQKTFGEDKRNNQLCLIVSRDGRRNSLTIHQDVDLYAANFSKDFRIEHPVSANRHLWIQLVQGEIKINELSLTQGDGVAVSEENKISITAIKPSTFLLFDLA